MMKYSIEILRAWASISFQKTCLSSRNSCLIPVYSISVFLFNDSTPGVTKNKNLKESIFSTDIYLGNFLFNQQDAKLFVCLTKICLLCSLSTC